MTSEGRASLARNVQPEDVSHPIGDRRYERFEGVFSTGSRCTVRTFLGWTPRSGIRADAIRDRVSHLILLNTAPVSHADYLLFQQDRLTRAAADMEALQAGSPDSKLSGGRSGHHGRILPYPFQGGPEATRASGTNHSKPAIELHEEGILKARKIEERTLGRNVAVERIQFASLS